MTSTASRLADLRRNLSQSDSLLQLLRAQIKQLKLSSDEKSLTSEEDALRRENDQLTIRVEALRMQLVALETKNGLEQIPLPKNDSISAKLNAVSPTDTTVESSDVSDKRLKQTEESKGNKPKKAKGDHEKKKQPKKHDAAAEANTKTDGDTTQAARAPDRQSLMRFLQELAITDITMVEHPEVFTVETMMPYLGDVRGAVGKNLFLKDKKKRLYLLAARHDAEVRLNDVAKQIGASGGLRLADESVLFENLAVRQGCVNPYALANDFKGNVKLLLDKSLVDGHFDRVNFHPMSNAATVGVSVDDFKKFLKAINHEPILIGL